MAKFFYKAKKGPKDLEQGSVEAESEAAAINKITQIGLYPISVTLEDETKVTQIKNLGFLNRIRSRDLTTFTSQLSSLLESGLTLYRALTVLEQQTENKLLIKIIRDVSDQVKEGKSLSESLGRYPKVFNNMYTSVIRSGEISGALEKVLKRLSDYSEKQQDLLSRVRAALAYPILMAVVGAGTIIVLFTVVIPKLITLFQDMGQVLPLPTRILIAISNFFVSFWWMTLAILLFVFFALRRNLFTIKGKLAFDKLKLSLPVFGKFSKQVQIADLTRTLGTMLGNGVPILQAMSSVSQAINNAVLKQEVEQIAKEIKEGASLAAGISKSKYFPILVSNMVTIGEEGGRLEAALLKVAEAYEKETDQSIKILTSLIEPAMILFMGSIVGFIVISMLLPIFQITLIAQ